MSKEKKILKRLDNLSEEDKLLCQEIVKVLGEWSKPREVAAYLKKHITTIYEMINNEDIEARRIGGRLRILSKSLILILEKK